MILISNKDREEVIRLLSLSSSYVAAAKASKKGIRGKSTVRESEILRRSQNLVKRLEKRPTIDNRNNKI